MINQNIDLLVDVFEFQFELSLLLIPLGHHLIEVGLHLDHLLVQPAKLLIRFSCLLVHLCFFLLLNFRFIYN